MPSFFKSSSSKQKAYEAAQLKFDLEKLAFEKEKQEQEIRLNEFKYQKELRRQQEEHERQQRAWEDSQNLFKAQEASRLQAEADAKRKKDAEVAAQQQAEQIRRDRAQATTPETLRALRDLIRQRYQLDMYIWSLKGARGPDRHIVESNMEKADAVLREINNIVDNWSENDKVWTKEEWKSASLIRAKIKADGKRIWKDNPPWNE